MSCRIFLHYGNCNYIDYAIDIQKKISPSTRLILIGDDENKHLADKYKIEFEYLEAYNDDEYDELHTAHSLGYPQERVENQWFGWNKFSYGKWMFLSNFLKKNKDIKNFWHYDSDVYILSDLEKRQKELTDNGYDFIRQDRALFKGYINDSQIIHDFVDHIKEYFQEQNDKKISVISNEMERGSHFIERDNKRFKYKLFSDFSFNNKIDDVCVSGIPNARNYESIEYDRSISFHEGRVNVLYIQDNKFYYNDLKVGKLELETLNMSWVKSKYLKAIYDYIMTEGECKYIFDFRNIKSI
jgi:hypothetical protein